MQSEIAPPPPDKLLDGLLPRALILFALAGSWLLSVFFVALAEPIRHLDMRCEPWDDAAVAAVARFLAVRDETAEAFFGDAIFRLRRARRNCRAGWVDLARTRLRIPVGRSARSSISAEVMAARSISKHVRRDRNSE